MFIIVLWGYIYENRQFDKQLLTNLQKKTEFTHRLFNKRLKTHTIIYEKLLTRIINEDGIKKAFKERKRDELYKLIKMDFKQLVSENKYIKIMTFRLSDGSAFLRVHKPSMFGDAINKKRKIIIDTNIDKKINHGFEIGKLQMTYRIVIPIFLHKEYLGLLEFGVEPTYFIEDVANIYNLNYALVVKDGINSALLDKSKMISKNGFSLFSQDELTQFIFKNINLKSRKFIDFKGRYYSIETGINLNSHKGNLKAFLLVIEDITDIMSEKNSALIEILVVYGIVILLLILILNYNFDYFINKIKKQIYTDDLTKLRNRKALMDDMNNKNDKILILLDINDFKNINEIYGVTCGSNVLIEFANLLVVWGKKLKFSVYRVSSDEFILLSKYKEVEPTNLDNVVKGFLFAIQKYDFLLSNHDQKLNLEVSAGIAYGEHASLEKADMALKSARMQKKQFLVYSSKIDSKKDTQKLLVLKKDISNAIENNNIVPYYQPIVDTNGKIIKYEALVRMIKVVDGKVIVVTPNDFLEASQKFNLYSSITKIVIQKSLKTFENLDIDISINLSPEDIVNEDTRIFIEEALMSCKSPQNIIFEITENEQISNLEYVGSFIDMVKKYGVKIAIDDFGSGYSNYSHILELKPDYLKIDGSLVKNIVTNHENHSLVKTIIVYAKEFNIKTIAEYVSDKEIFDTLKELGIDQFQGYLFGKAEDKLIN